MFRAAVLLLLLCSTTALAYEGAGLKHAEDAGVHVPVLTKPPVLKKFVPAALDGGEGEGAVTLLVDIAADGSVANASVSKSASPALDDAALAAVQQFEFEPAEVDGKPALVRIEYTYHFTVTVTVPTDAGLLPDAGVRERPVNLKGHVLERVTREPVAAASVLLPKLGRYVETDATGRYAFREVPTGELEIEVTEAHHRKYETTVTVVSGEVLEVDLWIVRKPSGSFETTVIGERDKKEVTRRVLEKEELTTVPGTFGDPLRVLQNLPGMARPPFISGALLVRGAQPDDTLTMVDGVPIPLLYHFGGGPSVLSPSYIEQIEFYPGAFGAKYGRAIGGVVDITTGGAEPKSIHGTGELSLINAGLYLEAPIGTDAKYGSVSIAGRHSLIDLFLPALLQAFTPPGQSSFVASPAYWDYQARYRLTLGRHKLELGAFGSSDNLGLKSTGDDETQPFSLNTEQAFHRVRLRWSYLTDSGVQLSFAPTVGITRNNLNLSNTIKFGQNSTDLTVRGAAKVPLVKDMLAVEAGLDLNARFFENVFETPGQATMENPDPPPNVQKQRVNLSSYAAYVEAVATPLERVKVVPGVRVDVYALPRGLEPSFEPRIAGRLRLTDWLAFKAAAGLYRQAPTSNQLDPLFGNPKLGLSQAQQNAVGFELRPLPSALPRLSLDVQGFYNARSQLVVSSNALVERDGRMQFERLKNGGIGRAYGLEVLLKHDLTEKLYGWIAYTLSRSEQLDEATQTWVPVSFDQTHIMTIVASYKFDFGLELGLRFRLTGGRPETPVLGATFDADTGTYAPVYGAAGSQRGSIFNQLDIRAEKQWVWSYWKLAAYLDIQNIYNAPNPEQTIWDYRYKESAPLRGLPFLPTLGLRAEF